jgi:hypothetical protein
MQLEHSTDLTDSLDDSFDGASLTNSTELWAPPQSDEPIGYLGETLAFEQETPIGFYAHSFTWKRNPTRTGEEAQAAGVRFLCHILISRAVDEALPELVETIATVAEFYELRIHDEKFVDRRVDAVPVTLLAGPTRPDFSIEE